MTNAQPTPNCTQVGRNEAAKARALDGYLSELDVIIREARAKNIGQDWQLHKLVMEREDWDRRIARES
jgi:hypothetical protein